MENLVLVVHLLVALAIIGLILLQQGKGAEMGASFGAGASATLFGSAGSGNFFSRMTAILATVFFITSFTLAIMAKQNTGEVEGLEGMSVEAAAESVDAELSELPVVNEIPDTAEEVELPDVEAAEPVEPEAPEAADPAPENN
jgi:preprotein translocase subunit SecG